MKNIIHKIAHFLGIYNGHIIMEIGDRGDGTYGENFYIVCDTCDKRSKY